MSKSFSEFCNEQKSSAMQEENVKNAYEELKDMNYDELTERLYRQVREQKENGTFDFESLSSSVENIKPFISNETYFNMKNMLEKLK